MSEKAQEQESVNFLVAKMKSFLKILKDDETRFRLVTSFKISLVPVFSLFMLAAFIWVLLRLDLHFFEAHSLKGIQKFEESSENPAGGGR